MAETITMAFFLSVWAVSWACSWLLRTYAPLAVRQCEQIETAGLVTAMLGAVALWLLFTIGGVTAAG